MPFGCGSWWLLGENTIGAKHCTAGGGGMKEGNLGAGGAAHAKERSRKHEIKSPFVPSSFRVFVILFKRIDARRSFLPRVLDLQHLELLAVRAAVHFKPLFGVAEDRE